MAPADVPSTKVTDQNLYPQRREEHHNFLSYFSDDLLDFCEVIDLQSAL